MHWGAAPKAASQLKTIECNNIVQYNASVQYCTSVTPSTPRLTTPRHATPRHDAMPRQAGSVRPILGVFWRSTWHQNKYCIYSTVKSSLDFQKITKFTRPDHAVRFQPRAFLIFFSCGITFILKKFLVNKSSQFVGSSINLTLFKDA